MSAILKDQQDAVALSDLAHRSMDTLDHEFIILTQLIIKQTNVSAQLEKELEHIQLGLHDLVKGKLSPFLLTPHILRSSILQIQDIITNNLPHFHVLNKDPLFYYSRGKFLFTRLHLHLYLTLKIPTSPFQQLMTMYRVYSYPVPVNSSSNHATQLIDLPSYFLHTADKQHYATITSEKISQCTGTTTLFCSFSKAMTASASPSCLSAVFFNQKDAVSSLCDFRFLMNMLPPAVYGLSPSNLLLYRTSMLALDCPGGQRILKGCFFCIVRLPCRCSMGTSTTNNQQPLLTSTTGKVQHSNR